MSNKKECKYYHNKVEIIQQLKNWEKESENDDQQEADEENIIDGVEEEEEEDEEDTGEGIPQEVDGNSDNEVELQRELEKMNTVEDIDDQTDDDDDNDDDDNSNEGIRSRERLMGREETTEEIFEWTSSLLLRLPQTAWYHSEMEKMIYNSFS